MNAAPAALVRDAIDGVLLLDKPVGPSSNAVLQQAKRLLGAARAGHTGTLDPLASGLLVVTFGEATKFSGELLDADKTYRARLKLGERTSTGDAEGEVTARSDVPVGRERLLAVLERFRGELEQVPPMHAAIKHEGRPLYAYARAGEEVPRAPRRIVIRSLDLESFDGNTAVLRIECSKGTYVRVLADDIGAALGCGAHLAGLERTAVGPFALGDATGLDELDAASLAERRRRLLPPEVLLAPRPRLALDADLAAKFRHGRAVPVSSARGTVGVFAADGTFIGAGEVDVDSVLRPKRLLAH
jgi:tRNA pseudouridine55 synthase